MEKNTVLRKSEVFHFRQIVNGVVEPKGGVAICYEPVGDEAVAGIDMCSPLDVYDKKRARSRVARRLRKNQEQYVRQIGKLLTWEEAVNQFQQWANDYWNVVNQRHERNVAPLELGLPQKVRGL